MKKVPDQRTKNSVSICSRRNGATALGAAEGTASGAALAVLGGSLAGFVDAPTDAAARFESLNGLLFDRVGGLLVADRASDRGRRIDIADRAFPVRTVLGRGTNQRVEGPFPGDADHPGVDLDGPVSLAFDGTGALWVLQGGAQAVTRTEGPFGASGRMRLVAGDGPQRVDEPAGYFLDVSFENASACAFDPLGRLVVADFSGNRIRRVTPDGWVTTLAGRERNETGSKYVDGPGAEARFANPIGVVVSKDGTIYVGYLFDHQAAVALDTRDFEQALRAARLAGGGPEARGWLERALALYQGDFLPEFENEWVVALRHGFQEQALTACRQLLAIYDASEPATAPDLLRRALAIDPLSPELNREVILQHLEAEEPQRALGVVRPALARGPGRSSAGRSAGLDRVSGPGPLKQNRRPPEGDRRFRLGGDGGN